MTCKKDTQLTKRVATNLLLGVLLTVSVSSSALGEETATPPEITPPPGNVLFLATHGVGTQNYICLPGATGKSNVWAFYSPQATLSVTLAGGFNQQVLTHFLSPLPRNNRSTLPGCASSVETDELNCPTWQSSSDSSAVWGEKTGSITAGSDANCPNAGAVACLLLKIVTTRHSPHGPGLLGETTYVQRLQTVGGSAPAGSCHTGDQALVPYQANYLFYSANDE